MIVYLYDLFFVVVYLFMKRTFTIMQDRKWAIFISVRDIILWLEYSFILMGIYFAPAHSPTERGVSFAMCILTKLVWEIVIEKNIKSKI